MWNYWWKSRWARPKVKSRRSTTESSFSYSYSYSGHNLVIILFCLIHLMHNLLLVHAGDCLSNRSDLGENDFILECTEDGNYKPIQCDNKTGYCFCVDKFTGRPNSDTTTRNRSPNCNESSQPSGPSNFQSSSASTSSFRNSQSSSSPQSSAYSQSRKPEHSRDGHSGIKKGGSKNRRCQTVKRLSFLGQLLAVIKQSRGFRRSNGDSGGAGGNIRYPFGIPLGIRPTIGSTTQHHNSVDYDDEELIVKKFNDFDTNSDQNLSQSELNELIRSIRSILMPSLDGCVNSFFDFCDADQNGEIGRDEFVNCLNLRNTQKLNAAYAKRKKEMRANGGGGGGKGRDQASITNRPTAFGSNVAISSRDSQYQRSQIRPVSTPKSPESEEFGQSKAHPSTSSSQNQFRNVDPSLALFLSANSITLNEDGARSVGASSGTGGSGGMSLLSGSSSSQNGKNESRLDCLVTRSNAIESARINPNGPVFIPECTKEGYYASVQCHQLHCWCVSRVSGQTIKHLVSNSTETMRACDQIRKGCDHRRRTKFHARLRQLLRHSKLSCNSVFDHIDRDRSQQVDHHEWKLFQQQLLSKSQSNRNSSSQRFNSRLQKCFRTEINYCDQNGDERLSQQEWVQCCNDNVTITSNGRGVGGVTSSSSGGATSSAVFHHQATADAYNQKKNRQRTGPNPFKTILKPE